MGKKVPSNADLVTLPCNADLGTLPPNSGLGTLPPNDGLGTLPPNARLGILPPNAGLVQDAQESDLPDHPPGSQDSSHDIQATTAITTTTTTTSVVPAKKRSSKRGAKGTIQLTQVGIEEVKNVAQCSLVTSTGKVVTFKFSLDYDKPSELCRHLVREGNGLLFHSMFYY